MISVLKADKTREPFNEEKVIQSIRRARIPEALQQEVLNHVTSKVYDGISTNEIYHHILEFLNASPHPYSKATYSLKQSIMALGPSGYPFEDFIARLLDASGYTTKVRQILSGKCVTHEIDVIATKNGKSAMIEAKFHNSPGTRSEVHVALYTHARFEDVKIKNHLDEAWLVTNTKATIDATNFAQCSGMKILSWDYPKGEGLRELVEQSRLYPITMLTSISTANKLSLLSNHIILCQEIVAHPSLLDILPLSKEDRAKTLAEVTTICRTT